jgi:hypothetical protein
VCIWVSFRVSVDGGRTVTADPRMSFVLKCGCSGFLSELLSVPVDCLMLFDGGTVGGFVSVLQLRVVLESVLQGCVRVECLVVYALFH